MNIIFANHMAIPAPAGAFGYVRTWKQTSGMTTLGAVRVTRGHGVMVT